MRLRGHPNIVDLREVVVLPKRDGVFLVFEYSEHDVALLVDNLKKPFEEAQVKCVMLQLLRAVQICHKNWVVHRDIKLSNLLYHRGEVKLADFGLARCFTEPHGRYTTKVVTLWYRAPELLLGSQDYTNAIDMWAVGCVFGELLCHHPLVAHNTESEMITGLFRLLGAPNESIWPGCSKLPGMRKLSLDPKQFRFSTLSERLPKLPPEGLHLLEALLTYDPARRLTVDEALAHPYWSEFPRAASTSEMPHMPDSRGGSAGLGTTSGTSEVHMGGRRRLRGGDNEIGFAVANGGAGGAGSMARDDGHSPLLSLLTQANLVGVDGDVDTSLRGEVDYFDSNDRGGTRGSGAGAGAR